jgi:hypothetical protein
MKVLTFGQTKAQSKKSENLGGIGTMATNWIALFEASAPPDNSDKNDNCPREKPIVSNVPIVRPEKYEKLIEELNQLNARWEKANTLEQEAAKLLAERDKLLKKIHPDLDRIQQLNERANDLLMGAV